MVASGSNVLELPLRAVSVLNKREYWSKRAKRAKAHREAVQLLWPRAWKGRRWAFPLEVVLTRVYPARGRPLDRFDNLPASVKAIVDQVCAQLGVDDSDERLSFRILQERGAAWGVRVELREGCPHRRCAEVAGPYVMRICLDCGDEVQPNWGRR